MRVSRLYYSGAVTVGSKVVLDAERSHYLARVLRLPLQAEVIVFNGDGHEYLAQITHLTKREVTLTLTANTPALVDSTRRIHLYQAMSQREKMDWIIQKAVELGVTEITPVYTEFSQAILDTERIEKRLQHWQRIIISACEQSGRNRLPILRPATTLVEYCTIPSTALRLVLDPTGTQTLRDVTRNAQPIHLLIGPEGGFSTRERETLLSFCQVINLGKRILRMETAAIAMLAVLQFCC